MFFDFEKEINLGNAVAAVFEALQERLADKTGYGIVDWYEDVAWAVRALVDAGVPYFVGKNKDTWLNLAQQYEDRATVYVGNSAYFVPWAEGIDDAMTWADAAGNIEDLFRLGRLFVSGARAEHEDLSGLLPSGEKGINLGEAMKLTRAITDKFWQQELRWSRVPSPHKAWLKVWRADVMTAYTAMGEAQHSGDLGDPNVQNTGDVPWSAPVQ
jgi:hypothetical protein